jgi:hypothetical protein
LCSSKSGGEFHAANQETVAMTLAVYGVSLNSSKRGYLLEESSFTMKPLYAVLGAIFSLFVITCSQGGFLTMSNPTKTSSESPSHIGTATMEENGDIVLMLRADLDEGGYGEAYFRYKPGTAQYTDILQHLGGLKPGESKLVPPWPDERGNVK